VKVEFMDHVLYWPSFSVKALCMKLSCNLSLSSFNGYCWCCLPLVASSMVIWWQ